MTPIMPAKLALTSRISPPAGITAFSVTEPVGRVLAAMCAQADCLIAWNGSIAHITPLDARPSAGDLPARTLTADRRARAAIQGTQP